MGFEQQKIYTLKLNGYAWQQWFQCIPLNIYLYRECAIQFLWLVSLIRPNET